MTCQGRRGRACWPQLSLRSAERQEDRKFRTQQGPGWWGEYRSPSSWESRPEPRVPSLPLMFDGGAGWVCDRNQHPEKAQGPAGASLPTGDWTSSRAVHTTLPAILHPPKRCCPVQRGALQQSLCAGWPGCLPPADCDPYCRVPAASVERVHHREPEGPEPLGT